MKIWNDNSVVRLVALMTAMGLCLWGWLEISLRMLPNPIPVPVARLYGEPQATQESEVMATLVVFDQTESSKAAR